MHAAVVLTLTQHRCSIEPRPQTRTQARLTKIKGYIMCALYFVVVGIFCLVITLMNR